MKNSGHLFPFLWLSGQTENEIRKGIEDVAASGCSSVCVESRTHPDFLGAAWWHDLDIVCDECKKRNMTFYVLDDTHFPSGYANGAAKGTPWCRMMMTEEHMDVLGPKQGGCILVKADHDSSMLVAVVAAQKTENHLKEEFVDIGGWAVDDLIDLTDTVQDGLVQWDVPEGTWRVFVLSAAYVSERNPPQFFANPLLPEGGQLMIDTVYEPHYQHFSREFGKTFLGFFSDEPALRAGRGCKAVLGEYPRLPIPWRMDLPELLTKQIGKDARGLLPGLWYDIGEDTSIIRYALMDTVSRLYGENYSMCIGDWCREHGVVYVGHVIEQNGAHSRLGQGAGHYFRAVSGQDMSGMDYVLHELKMDFQGTTHAWKSQDFEADDDFFRYMLPQMTASAARIDPKKKGRALCEIFGAYGWQENISEMRYLVNLLLSRGINYFVPHAFSLKPCPDPDSPPHFGHFNPLMPFITEVFKYMEKCCNILSEGEYPCDVAVVYHAEAEWSCGKSTMQTQCVVKELFQHQIPCEIVPIDDLNRKQYKVVLIPYGERWPRKLFDMLHAMQADGSSVVFIEDYPHALSDSSEAILPLLAGFESAPLAEAAQVVRQKSEQPIEPMGYYPLVTCMPYQKDGHPVLVLFNDDSQASVNFHFSAQQFDRLECFDPERNQYEVLPDTKDVSITMMPGQLLLLSDQHGMWPDAKPKHSYECVGTMSVEWTVTYEDGYSFTAYAPLKLDRRDKRFAGKVVCSAKVDVPSDCSALKLDIAGAVRFIVDGENICSAWTAPYILPISPGKHFLEVQFVLPLVYRYHDALSFYNYIDAQGIAGEISLLKGMNDAT